MNDLLITIQKAAHIFGLSHTDAKQASDVVHQTQRQGYVSHEDMSQLANLIPGAYKILAAYLGIEPKELHTLLDTRLYSAELFFIQYNAAINKVYPAITRVDLGPTEEEWEEAKGKFRPMVDWVGRKLNWMMK